MERLTDNYLRSKPIFTLEYQDGLGRTKEI